MRNGLFSSNFRWYVLFFILFGRVSKKFYSRTVSVFIVDSLFDLADARKELKLADHMVYITYKLLNDKKIIISVANHVCNALNKAIFAFLENEKRYKRIYHLPENKQLRIMYFLRDYSEQFRLSLDDEEMITKLNNLNNLSSGSYNVERGDEIHIVNGSFKVETLSIVLVKRYLESAKLLINKIESNIKP